jgi:serine/threonine protein kinase
MSVEAEKNGPTYEERLSKLESHLEGNANDEAMLAGVGMAMRALLSGNGESEAHIRQILERQFNQGNLRRESYELVESMLGKLVAEERAQEPATPVVEEPYVDTAVIERPDQQAKQPVITTHVQVGSVLRDRFLLKEQVAEGSMGTVYKALDRRLAEAGEENAFVAIKVLSPKLSQNSAALRAMQQEAAKGRCLSHPNIVRFIDLDREDDLFFIIMEWLEGRSLSSILDEKRGNALELPAAMNIVQQTARALDYAHQRGVVHADIKPGNIMITPDGKVKLIDFGVARVRQKENEGKSRFDPNVMRAGSPAYSSMQVLTGEDPVPADDVFSLACLLYRLVAGYRVFGPRNAADAAEEGMEPQPPEELSAKQWQAVKKALSYSRVTRFKSPKAFMDALGPISAGPARAKPEQPKPQPEPVTVTPIAVAEPGPAPIAHDETTEVALDVPLRAERDPIMYEPVDEDEPRRSRWRLAVVGLIIIAATFVVVQPELFESLTGIESPVGSVADLVDQIVVEEAEEPDEIQDLEALPDVDVAGTDSGGVTEELVIDSADGSVAEVTASSEETIAVAAEETAEPAIDFSLLPAPTLLMSLDSSAGAAIPAGTVTLREDAAAAIIDLVRDGDLSEPYSVQFVESGYSGNQSAREAGQYEIENGGLLVFDVGQPRARIEISMRSDTVREPDRVVTLSVRNAMGEQNTVATISLTLEDDDQRAFEAGLPANTVGFAVNQISVRESDPAMQVDVFRYNPDNEVLEVNYTLTDVTATEGQDYFAPGLNVVYFAAGQRAAKIIVPLGQDARPEQDEAFMLELETAAAPSNSNIFSQIAVMIRDDDS